MLHFCVILNQECDIEPKFIFFRILYIDVISKQDECILGICEQSLNFQNKTFVFQD